MATGVASWSKTASANASADQNVNAAEGMAPAQVNDAMRAMMASTAMWRDDTAGVTTAGTSTAYTLTTNQGFASLAALDGRKLAIIMHTSSGGAPTLSVDGLAAKPIRLQTGVTPGAAVLVQGSPYSLVYSNANGEFLVRDQTGTGIPTGAVTPFAGSAAPAGWLLCAGQTASQTTYAALYALIGTTYGPAVGGTFTLPDLRGRVIAGLDSNLPGSFANRITVAGGNFDGTVLGGAGGGQNVTIAQNQLPNVAPTFTGNALAPHSHTPSNGGTFVTFASGGGQLGSAGIQTPGVATTSSDSAGTPSGTVSSINGNVTQQTTANVQPTMTLNYIIKT